MTNVRVIDSLRFFVANLMDRPFVCLIKFLRIGKFDKMTKPVNYEQLPNRFVSELTQSRFHYIAFLSN